MNNINLRWRIYNGTLVYVCSICGYIVVEPRAGNTRKLYRWKDSCHKLIKNERNEVDLGEDYGISS